MLTGSPEGPQTAYLGPEVPHRVNMGSKGPSEGLEGSRGHTGGPDGPQRAYMGSKGPSEGLQCSRGPQRASRTL